MAITRQQKEQLVEDLKKKLGSIEVIILTDFRGLTVPDQQDLRGKLRDTDAEYQVVKNTLMRIALQEIGRPVPEEYLTGPTALTLLHDDIGSPTEALLNFAKETGTLEIKGGIVGDRVVGAVEVEKLADLPPREILQAQLLGAIQGPGAKVARTLQAPASNLARILHAPMRDLMTVMQTYARQQEASQA